MFASYRSYGDDSIYYRLDSSIFRKITSIVAIPIVMNIRMMNFGISLYLLAITIFNIDFSKKLFGIDANKKNVSTKTRLLIFLVPVVSMILPDPDISTYMYLIYHTSNHREIIGNLFKLIEILYKISVLIILINPVRMLIRYVLRTKITFLKKRLCLFAMGLILANIMFYYFFYLGIFSISVDKVIRSGFWIFENVVANLPKSYPAGSSLIFVIIAFCISILLSFNMDISVTLFASKKIQKNLSMMNEVLGETLHSQKNLFYSMQILIQKIDDKTKSQEIPEVFRMKRLVNDSLDRTTQMLDTLKEVKYNYLNKSILSIIDNAVNEVNIPEYVEVNWNPDIYEEDDMFYGMYDKYHLENAIVNILNNGIEAIEQANREHGQIDVSISFLLRWMIIEIKDNGIGMKAKEMKRAFSPHYSGKIGKMNWGLGLPYVYKVINAHLGQIKINSKYKEYTSVLIMLPLEKKKKLLTISERKRVWGK
jgi:hypothetical protein